MALSAHTSQIPAEQLWTQEKQFPKTLLIDRNCSSMRSLPLKTSRTSLSHDLPQFKEISTNSGAELTSIADTKAKFASGVTSTALANASSKDGQ